MISFEFNLPPTLNHYYGFRGSSRYIKKDGKAFRAHVQDVVAAAGHQTIEGKVAVFVTIWPKNNIRQDIMNREKALSDAMTHAGVWLDDCQVDCFMIIRKERVPGGRCKVVICPLDGEIEARAIEVLNHVKQES